MNDIKAELTFFEWVIRLKNRNSPTGDVANDVLRDKCIIGIANNIEAYIGHIKYSHNACDEAIAALKAAWKSYRAYLKSHTTVKR